MMTGKLTNFASAMMLSMLASQWAARGAITKDGIWTGNDWYDDDSKIGVRNGMPYSDDAKVSRRITAPLTKDGSVEDTYMSSPNVQRVMRLFSSADWDRGFPQANEIYTYDNFLKAVAKFPAFCNEKNTE
jgi:hypothetical protein